MNLTEQVQCNCYFTWSPNSIITVCGRGSVAPLSEMRERALSNHCTGDWVSSSADLDILESSQMCQLILIYSMEQSPSW